MHILVTGSDGQLGSELKELAPKFTQHNFTFTDHQELDISNRMAMDLFFSKNKFDTVINCAAFTAVDKCETEKGNADAVNIHAVKVLAQICSKKNMRLIHVSTDYVYDGKGHIPYKETDPTSPESYYGYTKLEGEKAVEECTDNAIIIRTSWLYSTYGHNFIKTILKYAVERDKLTVVFDQVGTPTYAADLAETILKCLNIEELKTGIHLFNYSNEGICSWYDFAMEIIRNKNISCNISPIETKDYPLPAPRPAYSVMNKTKIKEALNIEIPYWKDSLERCLNKM